MAVQFPKNALFPGVAIDGQYTYNGIAFITHGENNRELFMILTAPADRTVVIVLSFDDLRRLIELTGEER